MDEDMLTDEQIQQLETLFASLTVPVELRLSLDGGEASEQTHALANQLADASRGKLTVHAEEVSSEDGGGDISDPTAPLPHALPTTRVLAADRSGTMRETGIAFHGVPGGRQFVALLAGILDAGGNGQGVASDELARIDSLEQDVDILLLVSLTCPYCQATVEACDRIATLTGHVRAEAYDIAEYPQLADEYQSDGVPVVVVTPRAGADGSEPLMAVGGRDVSGILDLIDQTLG
ncbi:thioredoxin family protein [Bifidobacterium choloepi]|uniref:Thioredoxin-like fold domain-containing protein n=1 Tax=Bifidobacterium choloepi TaxID=2614131 RepID=A0A6I5MZS9_9BIFI|nr:thioredoxin family protein [Bifidobacterium choloepi]NEG69736.1 hypothetical protein [Bifidobacterium choloepi]